MDRQNLEWALADADMPVLLMVLVQLTGDRRWIEPPFTPKRDIRLFPDESGGLPDAVQDEIRNAVLDLLCDDETATRRASTPDPELFAAMMSNCVGEEIADEYVPLFLEEMGVVPSWPAWEVTPDPARLARSKVLIIGAGLSGIATAVILQRVGIPYEIVEKHPEVGGTWYENTYPESGVDTPNHFYSYSFRPNLDWTSYFSKQHEVLDYIKECVDHYGIRDHIRFDTEVIECRWEAGACEWVTTVRATGTPEGNPDAQLRSAALVIGVGQLSQPAIPEIAGLDTFEGPVFHTARWRHDVDLTGKRVALIGAGASAMQVARTVAAQAAHLDIYQRSPHWIAPNQDYHRTVSDRKRWLMHHVPGYAQWYRFVVFWRYGDGLHRSLFVDPEWADQDRSINARNDRHRDHFTQNYRRQLADRDDLLTKCLPTYPPYGKRMLVDNGWFDTIKRDNVDLITQRIDRFTPTGIVTADGHEHTTDVAVMATGFHARKLVWPIRVYGERSLEDAWTGDNATAYLGITVPGFPNMFLLHGPNTALAHGGSVIFQSECQARYLTRLLMRGIERGIDAFDVLPDRHDDYVRRVDEQHQRMVWSHPGMTNWYRNADGRVVSVSPWRLVDYWHMTREPDLDDYAAISRDEVALR